MDTKILRSKILDLAIRGKLVPQDAADGSALDLLAQIGKERGCTIKPLTEDVPFDIPKNWCWVRLGDVVNLLNGFAFKSSHYVDYGIRVIRIANVQDGYIKDDAPAFYPTSEYDNIRNFELFEGDLLMSLTGNVGRVGVLQKELLPAALNQRVACLRQRKIPELKAYLFCLFQSHKFADECMASSTGVAQKNMSTEWLKKYPIPLPPLAEQKRIVAKVEELLAEVEKIEQAQKDIADSATILQSKVLDLAIRGKLVPQDAADGSALDLLAQIGKERGCTIKPLTEDVPFDIPENWCWVKLGDLGEYRKGPFGSSLTKSMFVPDGPASYKVYEQKNAINKDASLGHYFISKEKYEEMRSFVVRPHDIIVSCAGTIGETYIIPEDAREGIINQALMRVKLHTLDIVDYWLLYFDFVLRDESQKHSKGTAIKNIPPFDIFKKLPFPLPPLAEQKRIVAKVEELLEDINKLK